MSRRGLGKGLDALLGGVAGKGGAGAAKAAAGAPPAKDTEKVSVDKLVAGKFQPRKRFTKHELNALADSIRQHGIIQPLVLRPLTGNRYEIVAGERRYRAAKLAGLKTVPAVVRELSDKDTQLFALVENLQRADLTPIEQARGIALLIEEAEITHAAAAEYVGLSRPAVSNLLRLLELSPEVQTLVDEGKLDMGHARALLSLPGSEQSTIAKEVIFHNWTVRQTEQRVRQQMRGGGGGARGETRTVKDADTRRLEKELSEKLTMRVDIAHRKSGTGTLTLHYGSLETLDKVIGKLKK